MKFSSKTRGKSQYVFVGNRKHVLIEMLSKSLQIKEILVQGDSFLEKEIENLVIDPATKVTIFRTRDEVNREIEKYDNHRIIFNGCAFKIEKKNLIANECLNVHPSYLPQLRGFDPVPGAVYFGLNSGATLHRMNSNFDAGAIISRVKVKNRKSKYDLETLYQLTFLAEGQVFLNGFERDFRMRVLNLRIPVIHRSFRRDGIVPQLLTLDSAEDACRKVRVYASGERHLVWNKDGIPRKLENARIIKEQVLRTLESGFAHQEIVTAYGNKAIVKWQDSFIEFTFKT
jgi:methionyl-tRNA formyltransferase